MAFKRHKKQPWPWSTDSIKWLSGSRVYAPSWWINLTRCEPLSIPRQRSTLQNEISPCSSASATLIPQCQRVMETNPLLKRGLKTSVYWIHNVKTCEERPSFYWGTQCMRKSLLSLSLPQWMSPFQRKKEKQSQAESGRNVQKTENINSHAPS